MRNPLTGAERSLFWTLVFAAFAATVAALGARAVDRTAVLYQQARTSYAIVRVLAPEGAEGMAQAASALAGAPHVSSAAPMTAGRAAALLGQISGQPVDPATVPDLRLIEIELASTEVYADVAGDIVAALAQSGVTAEVIEAPEDGGGVAALARQAALWSAAAFALIMLGIVWLAARGLAARQRELVTILCDLGATQGQAAGRIADEAAMLGLYAGGAGGLLAAAAAVTVMLLAIPDATLNTVQAMILPIDITPIVAAPLATAVAAGIGARAAAGKIHRQAARLG